MDSLPIYINGVVALLLLTSFVKIATALSIMRVGVGLQSANFGLVIFLLSVALSVLVVSPQIQSAGGLDALLNKPQSEQQLDQTFRPFLEKNVEADVLGSITKFIQKLDNPALFL